MLEAYFKTVKQLALTALHNFTSKYLKDYLTLGLLGGLLGTLGLLAVMSSGMGEPIPATMCGLAVLFLGYKLYVRASQTALVKGSSSPGTRAFAMLMSMSLYCTGIFVCLILLATFNGPDLEKLWSALWTILHTGFLQLMLIEVALTTMESLRKPSP